MGANPAKKLDLDSTLSGIRDDEFRMPPRPINLITGRNGWSGTNRRRVRLRLRLTLSTKCQRSALYVEPTPNASSQGSAIQHHAGALASRKPAYFDVSGTYAGYGEDYPTTRNGGKRDLVRRLKTKGAYTTTVMVGDGVSDLETKPVVELFIGFGGYVCRAKVQTEADHFIYALDELPPLLQAVA